MEPQPGIFVEGTRHHWFLEFEIREACSTEEIFAAIARVRALGESVEVVIGFSDRMCQRLLGPFSPPSFSNFNGLVSPAEAAHEAPATQGDVFVWVHSDQHDRNFNVALEARRLFTPMGSLIEDVPSWMYGASLDLTGFEDGTENPDSAEARNLAVLGEGPGEGGSLFFTQRWIHDLDSFHELGVPEQEAVFGRTKSGSIELDPLPARSHVERVVMHDEAGGEVEIYRRSVPYGSTTECGLYFLAFTDELAKIEGMLGRMFGHDGPTDRVLDFSSAVSGANYFAPPVEALDSLG